MAKKTVNFSKLGIKKLPNDKPAVYKILTQSGNNNYTGSAKKSRVRERINEHLGAIPGAKVQIEQMKSINQATTKESRIIKRSKPKHNKRDK